MERGSNKIKTNTLSRPPPTKPPYHHLQATARFQLSDGGPGAAVHAGPGAVDDGDGNVLLQLVHPVDHGPLGPAVGDAHVPEGRLAAAAKQKTHQPRRLRKDRSGRTERPKGGGVGCCGRPGALRVHVVDVVWNCVVTEHGRELLLEVGSQNLDQGWTCRAHKNFSTKISTKILVAPLLQT